MALRKKQPGGGVYQQGNAAAMIVKQKKDEKRIELLEEKVEMLMKLLFERSAVSATGRSNLFISKQLVYQTNLKITLTGNACFTPLATVDIRVSIRSNTTDSQYFSKRFLQKCDSTGSFEKVLTTLVIDNNTNYGQWIVSVAVFDRTTNGPVKFLEETIL
jgi:hypothetical protein